MRGTTIQYNGADLRTVSFRNNNASGAILDGQPVVLDAYVAATQNVSTYFGVDVKQPSEGVGASFPGMILGIAKCQKSAGVAIGEYGEAVVYGFTDVIVVRRTRAATSDSWPTVPAITEYCQLVVNSVNDALTISATLALGATPAGIFAGESYASSAGVASDTASSHSVLSAFSTATAQTTRMKGFVRLM